MSAAPSAIRINTFIDVNGQEQWITIRGEDAGKPVLLMVSGPGAALSTFAPLLAPWERELVLVQWDQPGAGSTHARHGEAGLGRHTLERLTDDLIAVTEAVRDRLERERLIVLAFSAGSIPGLMAASRRPDLFEAYAACGQIVHWGRQQALGYARLLERRRASADAEAVRELEAIGPPPWRSLDDEIIASKHMHALTPEESAAMAALDPAIVAASQSPPPGADYVADGVVLGDPRATATMLYARLRDEIQSFDAWRLPMKFEVPLFFLQGEHDLMTVTSEVERYARDVRAPRAEVATIRGSGHAGLYLPDELLRLLQDVVLRRRR